MKRGNVERKDCAQRWRGVKSDAKGTELVLQQ